MALTTGFSQNDRYVEKYEAVLWTLEKMRETILSYKMMNFSLRELTFSGNMYFKYLESVASKKVRKVLSLQIQRNDGAVL